MRHERNDRTHLVKDVQPSRVKRSPRASDNSKSRTLPRKRKLSQYTPAGLEGSENSDDMDFGDVGESSFAPNEELYNDHEDTQFESRRKNIRQNNDGPSKGRSRKLAKRTKSGEMIDSTDEQEDDRMHIEEPQMSQVSGQHQHHVGLGMEMTLQEGVVGVIDPSLEDHPGGNESLSGTGLIRMDGDDHGALAAISRPVEDEDYDEHGSAIPNGGLEDAINAVLKHIEGNSMAEHRQHEVGLGQDMGNNMTAGAGS